MEERMTDTVVRLGYQIKFYLTSMYFIIIFRTISVEYSEKKKENT